MKRLFVLTALLVGISLFSGGVLANEVEEESSRFEVTNGVIEFDTTLFEYANMNIDGFDESQKVREFLNMSADDDHRLLKLNVSGILFNDIIWDIDARKDTDEDTEDEFEISLTRDLSNGFVRVTSDIANNINNNDTFWGSITDDMTVTTNRRAGDIEAQVKIGLFDHDGARDEDTFLSYDITDDLNLTFKPYNADFTIGNVFEYGEDDQYENNPFFKRGVEVIHQLSDNLSISGTFWSEGRSVKNIGGVDGAEWSQRDIKLKGELTQQREFTSLTGGILLDRSSSSQIKGELISTDRWEPELLSEDYLDSFNSRLTQAPKESLILNLGGEHIFAPDLILNFETKLGIGSYEDEVADSEGSTTDFGLYTGLTKVLDQRTAVLGYYKLMKTSVELDDDELSITAHEIGVGAQRALDHGLTLTGELLIAPPPFLTKVSGESGGVEFEDEFGALQLSVGIKYEF